MYIIMWKPVRTKQPWQIYTTDIETLYGNARLLAENLQEYMNKNLGNMEFRVAELKLN